MIPDGFVLGKIWLAVAAHLWQTTLVVLPLFLLARLLKRAPARLTNLLWTLGLVKLLVPLAVLKPLTRMALLPALRHLAPSVFGSATTTVWLDKVYAVLEPEVLVSASASPGAGTTAIVLVVLTAVWVVGVGLIAALSIRRNRTYEKAALASPAGAPAAAPALVARVLRAVGGTGVPPMAVRVVRGSAMPAVRGLLRPRIILPEVLIRRLPTRELRAVLLHEDEHRRRFDPLRALLERAALCVFYFYPFIWPILKRLHSSCEMACDEAAVRAGIEPRVYSRALARTLRLGLLPAGPAFATTQEASSGISRRFRHIQHSGRYVTMTRHRLALLAAVMLVTAVSLIPLPPFAGTGESGDEVPPPPSPPRVAPVPDVAEVPAPEPAAEAITPPVMIPETVSKPVYPEAARKAGVTGDVVLQVEVKADGTVGAVTVKKGIPEAPELEKSAEEAARKWRFVPAKKGDIPITTTVAIPVAFRLDDEEKPAGVIAFPALIPESVIKPVYPEDARKAGISGKVILKVTVKVDGTPGAIEVAEGIEGYPALGENAVEAVWLWKFKPATKDGKPVETTVKVPVMFRLDDTKAEQHTDK